MTPNKKETPLPESNDASHLTAKIALLPSVNAAAVITEYGSLFGKQEINELVDSLSNAMSKVLDGNMSTCEAMLLGQAHALQSIFTSLSLRATKQEYIKNHESFLKLALKAQSQCRATLETLSAIKNPPIVFARQANIAHGNQQVNNNQSSSQAENITRAEKNNLNPNELLEIKNEQGLECRTTSTASNYDSKLEALETVNWPKK